MSFACELSFWQLLQKCPKIPNAVSLIELVLGKVRALMCEKMNDSFN